MSNTKIFGIGFQKTGTTTLDVALQKLGYSVCGPRGNLIEGLKKNDYSQIWELVKLYDAFEDNPWPILFKELDKKYPDSKFILTYRSESSWLKSVIKHFGSDHSDMREFIYGKGCPFGNEELYVAIYNKHNKEVVEYFSDRPHKLLTISWEQGHGWKELCSFLDKKIPKIPFPHANKTPRNPVEKKLKILKRNLYDLIFGKPKIMSDQEKKLRGLE